VGKVVEVLVEGPSRLGGRIDAPVKQLTGRSMTDHIVVFDGPDRLIGQTVRVTVDDASPFTLYGEVVTGKMVGVEGCREPDVKSRPTRFGLPVM
jgi:tRNA-2-methylthio-N6-dimethylallyladenosine synthase